MSDAEEGLQSLADRLRQERDQLRVQLNLARKEAKDEWDHLEQKWDELRGRMKVVAEEAGEVKEDSSAAAAKLAAELRDGYQRIRRLM